MKQITVELYDVNGRPYRYDAFTDGPLSEWLSTVAPKLGPHFNSTAHNATIRVFEHGE